MIIPAPYQGKHIIIHAQAYIHADPYVHAHTHVYNSIGASKNYHTYVMWTCPTRASAMWDLEIWKEWIIGAMLQSMSNWSNDIEVMDLELLLGNISIDH